MAGVSSGGVDASALNVPTNVEWMRAAAVPVSPHIPFFRIGEPIVISVSPTSAATEFSIVIPPGMTAFQYTNNNNFAVRLKGRQEGKPFVAVTKTTGWLWLPASSRIYTSLNPISVSAMSVDGPLLTQKAGTGFIELQYGTGS